MEQTTDRFYGSRWACGALLGIALWLAAGGAASEPAKPTSSPLDDPPPPPNGEPATTLIGRTDALGPAPPPPAKLEEQDGAPKKTSKRKPKAAKGPQSEPRPKPLNFDDVSWEEPEPPPRRSRGAIAGGIVMTSIGGIVTIGSGMGYALAGRDDDQKRDSGIAMGFGLALLGAGIPLTVWGARRVEPEESAQQSSGTLRVGPTGASFGMTF